MNFVPLGKSLSQYRCFWGSFSYTPVIMGSANCRQSGHVLCVDTLKTIINPPKGLYPFDYHCADNFKQCQLIKQFSPYEWNVPIPPATHIPPPPPAFV
jgi:hypothetical protein